MFYVVDFAVALLWLKTDFAESEFLRLINMKSKSKGTLVESDNLEPILLHSFDAPRSLHVTDNC